MADSPETDEEVQTAVTIRRAPRFSTFMVTGIFIGFIVTLILVSLYPSDPEVGFGATFGFFALFGVPVGAGLGAIVAIILDRRASRRAAHGIAGKLDVHVEDQQAPEADLTMDPSTGEPTVFGRDS